MMWEKKKHINQQKINHSKQSSCLPFLCPASKKLQLNEKNSANQSWRHKVKLSPSKLAAASPLC